MLEANRMGQLTTRNLDIADTREKLIVYSKAGLLSAGEGTSMLRLGEEKGDAR